MNCWIMIIFPMMSFTLIRGIPLYSHHKFVVAKMNNFVDQADRVKWLKKITTCDVQPCR